MNFRRGQNGIYTYTLSTVRSATDTGEKTDQQIILERAVSGREYVALLKQSDPSRMAVKKKVYCFLHENTYFELHQFVEPNVGLSILNTESDGPVVSVSAFLVSNQIYCLFWIWIFCDGITQQCISLILHSSLGSSRFAEK